MGANTSSAVAQALIDYSTAAAEINGALNNEATRLWSALSSFAATCTEYRTGIGPELAGELRTYVNRTAPTDAWVRQVGQDFAKADGRPQQNTGSPLLAAMGLAASSAGAPGFGQGHANADRPTRAHHPTIRQASPYILREINKEKRTATGQALQDGSQNYAIYIQGVEAIDDTTRMWLGTTLWRDPRKNRARQASLRELARARKGDRFKVKMGPEARKLAGFPRHDTVRFKARSWMLRNQRGRYQLGNLTKAGARDALFPKSKLGKKLWVLQLGANAYTNWKEFEGEAGDVRVAKTTAATAFDTAVQTGINIAATAVGTAAGGALGGAIGGPIGSAIGARVGGVAGSIAGAWVSKQVMQTDAMKDLRWGFTNTVGSWFD